MAARSEPYERAAAALLASSGCTVRKYRTGNTGRAYTKSDGWEIEVPHPRGPVSFGVFAHEVGHQLLHRSRSRRSQGAWLREIEAWEFALSCFDKFGLAGVERCRADAARHLRWLIRRAARRCSPETALRIIARYPGWVWDISDPRETVVVGNVPDWLYERALA